ncbi:MAG TPA: M28 family peptidase [Methylomirabilota bacterium]
MRLLAVLLLAVLAAPASDARSAPAPAFDGARALRDVERLVAIGPRPAGSPGAAQARQYIVAELAKAGLRARVEPFEAQTPHGRLAMANVVGVVPGRRPEVILVGGHYDTKWFSDIHFVGANDGGSSTALLLELARQLGRTRAEYTYWIAFFDGEEARETWTDRDSLYGSRRMAAELRRAGRLPRALIVVDMIGDRDLGIRREGFSTPWLTELIWGSATRLGHQAHFLADRLTVEDDHVPFLKAGVPAALLIDFDFPPWHTAADTLDKVSARSLQIVGEVVLDALPAVAARLARGDGAPGAR